MIGADLPRVADLIIRAFPGDFYRAYGRRREAGREVVQRELEAALEEDAEGLVAVEEERLVGAIIVRWRGPPRRLRWRHYQASLGFFGLLRLILFTPPPPSLALEPGDLYLETLAVGPEARERGVGGELLERIEEEACFRHLRRVLVHVARSNRVGRFLYAKAGFVPTRSHSRRYLLLVKPLA